MLLPSLPPPRLEVAGGHMVEGPEQGGSPMSGDTSVAPGGHDLLAWGDTAEAPRCLWCGEYSLSLTETEFFGDQTLFASPSPGFVPAFGTLHH